MMKKNIIVIIVLVVLITLIGVPKLFLNNKEEQLPEVKLKEIEKNKAFAIMVPDINGNGYIPYDGDKWPTEADEYYYSYSECVDNKGEKVENAIEYNQEENTANLTTNSTIYCTLYFDKYPYMYVPTHEVKVGEENWQVPIYMSEKVKKVEFVDYIKEGLNSNEENAKWWDLSDTEQGTPVGSVIAWLEPIQNDNGFYTLYIGSKKIIRATDLTRLLLPGEWESDVFRKSLTNLETIDFNNRLDTSKTTSLYSTFGYNTKLTKIEGIENWDISKVIGMQGLFVLCNNLNSVVGIENWNTSNVIDMTNMLNGCTNFDFDKIKNWNVSSVKYMGGLFDNCTNLTNINFLQNWTPLNINDLGSTFGNCTKLSDISGIYNWDVSKVTSFRALFYKCSSLENVDLSKWSALNIENINGMFSGCASLKTLDMRSATFIQIIDSSNYKSMFSGVPSTVTIIVKDIGQKNWLWNNRDTLNFIGSQENIKLSDEI